MRKSHLYIILLFLFAPFVRLHSQEIEQLISDLKNCKSDTTRLRLLSAISDECEQGDILNYSEPAIKLANELLKQNWSVSDKRKIINHKVLALINSAYAYDDLGKSSKAIELISQGISALSGINEKKGIGTLYNNLGMIYSKLGKVDTAFTIYNNAYNYFEMARDTEGMATVLNNQGHIYGQTGNIKNSLDYYLRSFQLREMSRNNIGMANSLNNIGVVYSEQGEYSKAKEYFERSILLCEKQKNWNELSSGYQNLGTLYLKLHQFDKALPLIRKSYSICVRLQNMDGVALALNNIGLIYNYTVNLDSALVYYFKAFSINKMSGNILDHTGSYSNIASVYLQKGDLKKAKAYADTAYLIGKKFNNYEVLTFASNILYKVDSVKYGYNSTLQLYKNYISARDSFVNVGNRSAAIKTQMRYEYEMRAIADSVRISEEKKLSAAQLKQEQTKRYSLYGGIILIALFAGFMVNRFRVTNKQKLIIELQKKEVEEKKEVIEEKQKEILDSINYAKRIQYTLLAHDEFLKENLPEHFTYFNPKDIVSGDFFWATKQNDKFYLAVCDSTGHGVPGAFMSLLNIGFLSEAINEKGLEKPSEVFDYVRMKLINSISKEGQKDGFDGILVCFDKIEKKLTYAAANNNPILIQNNVIHELAADRMPVGMGELKDNFKLYEINYQKGDMLFLYTDGYADQFGGLKGKKFKYKQLNELISTNSKYALDSQKSILKATFENWKGNLEQVDDVCVIGIRL